jgi:hypothetical protein
MSWNNKSRFWLQHDLVVSVSKDYKNVGVNAYYNDIRMTVVKILTVVSMGGGKPSAFCPLEFFRKYQIGRGKKYNKY